MRSFAFTALVAALLGTPALGQAQTTVSLYRGTSEYDLSGVDTAPTTAVRATRELSRLFVLEGGLSYVALEEDFGASKLYMPEALMQLQLPIGRFAPYIGGGVGLAMHAAENDQISSETDPTFLVAGGLRIDLPYNLVLGGDARIRAFETKFTGTGSEVSVGIGFRF